MSDTGNPIPCSHLLWNQSWKIGLLPSASIASQEKSLVHTDHSSSFSLEVTSCLPQNPVLATCCQDLRLSASMAPGGLRRAGTAAAPCCKSTSSPASRWDAWQGWRFPATFNGCVYAPRSQIPMVTTLLHHVKVHRAAQDAQPRLYISSKGGNTGAPALSIAVVRIDVSVLFGSSPRGAGLAHSCWESWPGD